jgi:mannose-6-phosphate isomerase-like protein (cupin superfamily)
VEDLRKKIQQMLNRRRFLGMGAVLGATATWPPLAIGEKLSMPTRITSIENAEHYKWGGPNGTDCDAWYLVKTSELSIIEEVLPPGTSETPHFHSKARQFFFVLEGELTIEVEHLTFVLRPGQGIEVAPRDIHQTFNRGKASTRMIVTSQPPSHGDRTEA